LGHLYLEVTHTTMSSAVQNTVNGGRVEIWSVSSLSAETYTTTLYVMVDIVKGEGVLLPPSLGWADFSFMMECMYARKLPL
jgi:hypothetical protein